MSHMVIYRGADGKPGYHQTDDIHDAINFVEQMRNDEGVEHARIFRLEEVVFEYRPYFRVELSAGGVAPMVIGAPQPAPPLPEPDVGAALNLATPAFENVADPSLDHVVATSLENIAAPSLENMVVPSLEPAAERIDLVEDVIDVGDFDENQPKTEVGLAKKGLFGR